MLKYEVIGYRINAYTPEEKVAYNFDVEETAVDFINTHKNEWLGFNLEKVLVAIL